MSATITITLSPEASALAQKFDAMPAEFPKAIKRAMDRALEIVTGRIQEKRLSGKGPFPVEQHRLGQVTQRLWRSTRAVPGIITQEGGTTTIITNKIGADVFYAAIHEFGGSKAPERAPFRTGIKENIPYITEEIEKEIKTTLQ